MNVGDLVCNSNEFPRISVGIVSYIYQKGEGCRVYWIINGAFLDKRNRKNFLEKYVYYYEIDKI